MAEMTFSESRGGGVEYVQGDGSCYFMKKHVFLLFVIFLRVRYVFLFSYNGVQCAFMEAPRT